MSKKFFTTFDVAELCGVVHTTVIRWIEEGKLTAYETPGGHRRIPAEHLLRFMKNLNIPIPQSLSETPVSVLVIDDEEPVLKMIQNIMKHYLPDIQVRICLNGIEALVAIGKQPPDLIIMDVIMPEMDGIQMCQRLKASPETSAIKIIAMSGKKLSQEQLQFITQNTDYFMQKPFSPQFLAEKICKILNFPAS